MECFTDDNVPVDNNEVPANDDDVEVNYDESTEVPPTCMLILY